MDAARRPQPVARTAYAIPISCAGLPGITTNLLAKRLREMEEFGLIEKVRGAGSDSGFAYRLTPLGAGLEPVVHALGHWAWQWMPAPPKGELRSIEWLLVALRRRYLGGASLRVELIADDVPYRIILNKSRAEIVRGATPSPDLTLRGSGTAISQLFLDALTGWASASWSGRRGHVNGIAHAAGRVRED